ncbi:MAG: MarR family transcriptional regulator [Myxococcales bacterium]|nr:MarR family transcriptional regulator [Myxococcales bacterium]MCB9520548.1 MarR family transcriptional regulator [Myxococcales bacterium]MCB9532591.1 MarR family transcriptional regulator [Myxococcales bacterium]
MKTPTGKHALRLVSDRLAELLDVDPDAVDVRSSSAGADGAARIAVAGFEFAVHWRTSGVAATVDSAAALAVERAGDAGEQVMPLVAVPFMGDVGRERCAAAGAAWLDLSGNALIMAPGLRIRVEGQPNRFKRRGRPSSPFAPKSARIARWLLMHPGAAFSQRDVARATGVDEGLTSRIVSRLEEDDLIERVAGGGIRARDPDLLLDAWREDYDFSKHDIRRGHVAARSGEALARPLCEAFGQAGIDYAATGLSAAWLMTRFTGFRLATVYLAEHPTDDLLRELGFREEATGANVWLVVPNDAGVFHGAAEHQAIRCVHPLQVYLDLLAHPERAKEAAEHLRAELLRWRSDG